VPEKPKPSVADQAPVKPSAGGHKQKYPHTAVKWLNPVPQADQVITEVELPSYHRPQSSGFGRYGDHFWMHI
jgi:hypothetical protein